METRFGLIPAKIKRRQFGGHWPASFKSALRLESDDICWRIGRCRKGRFPVPIRRAAPKSHSMRALPVARILGALRLCQLVDVTEEHLHLILFRTPIAQCSAAHFGVQPAFAIDVSRGGTGGVNRGRYENLITGQLLNFKSFEPLLELIESVSRSFSHSSRRRPHERAPSKEPAARATLVPPCTRSASSGSGYRSERFQNSLIGSSDMVLSTLTTA